VGAGLVVGADDPEAIAAALGSLLTRGQAAPTAAPEAIERFSYPSIARQMTDAVERAIARRQTIDGGAPQDGSPVNPLIQSPTT
jgi:hypothetical protein